MKTRYIALIAVGMVLILAITFFAQATTIYSAQVVAKEKGSPIGMAPFTDRVDFGDIPRGSSITKAIILENQGTFPNSIRVFVQGSIAKFIEVTPSSYILEAGETVEIKLAIFIPESATPEQKFTGRVIILRLPKRLW